MRRSTWYRLLVLLVVVLRIVGAPAQAHPHVHAQHASDTPAATQQEHCHEHVDSGANTEHASFDHHSPSSNDAASDDSHGACCQNGECVCPGFPAAALGNVSVGVAPGSQHVIAHASVALNPAPPNQILRPPA